MIFEYIKEGFHLTHKNWQVILLRLFIALLNILGFIFFMVLPVAVTLASIGVEFSDRGSLLELLRDPGGFLSGYSGAVVFILLAFIFYLSFASILVVFTLGGTLGVLRNSALDPEYRFSLRSFFEEGKSLFFRIIGFSAITLPVFIVPVIILAVLGAGGFSFLHKYGDGGSLVVLFLTYFLSLLLAISGIVVLLGTLTLITYGMIVLAVERISPMDTLKRVVGFIKENPGAVLFYILLVGALMIISVLLNLPLHMTQGTTGILIDIPYQLVSYALQAYLTVVLWSCLVVFYIRTTKYSDLTPTQPLDGDI